MSVLACICSDSLAEKVNRFCVGGVAMFISAAETLQWAGLGLRGSNDIFVGDLLKNAVKKALLFFQCHR